MFGEFNTTYSSIYFPILLRSNRFARHFLNPLFFDDHKRSGVGEFLKHEEMDTARAYFDLRLGGGGEVLYVHKVRVVDESVNFFAGYFCFKVSFKCYIMESSKCLL